MCVCVRVHACACVWCVCVVRVCGACVWCVYTCVYGHVCTRACSNLTYIVWADVNVSKPLWVAVFDAANVQLKDVFKSREEHIEK